MLSSLGCDPAAIFRLATSPVAVGGSVLCLSLLGIFGSLRSRQNRGNFGLRRWGRESGRRRSAGLFNLPLVPVEVNDFGGTLCHLFDLRIVVGGKDGSD